jgi:hypothetical protein
VHKTLVLNTLSGDSLVHKAKQKKGSIQCFTSVLFSPLRLSCRSRLVFSTLILSAALPGLRQVFLALNSLVLTLLQGLPLGRLLVRYVMKSRKSAAKHKARLSIGATNNFDRRSVSFLRGGFAF